MASVIEQTYIKENVGRFVFEARQRLKAFLTLPGVTIALAEEVVGVGNITKLQADLDALTSACVPPLPVPPPFVPPAVSTPQVAPVPPVAASAVKR
jgi:hypothetical protein